MFFADSQLMHGPMMPIFESVRAIPSTDLVQTFERDSLIGSQVRVHTNIKKKTKKKRQKQMRPKLIPSEKQSFRAVMNCSSEYTARTNHLAVHPSIEIKQLKSMN